MFWLSVIVGLSGLLCFFRTTIWKFLCTRLGVSPVVQLVDVGDQRWRSVYQCIAPCSRGHAIHYEMPLCVGYAACPSTGGLLKSPMQNPVVDLAAQILIKRRTAPPSHWTNMSDFYPGPKGVHNDLALTFYRLLDPTLKAEWPFSDISLVFRQLWLHARPLFPRRMALYAATTHLPHHDQPTCFLHHDGERLYVRSLRDLSVNDTCSINWLPLRASMENPKAELSKWNLDASAAHDIPPHGSLFDPLGNMETQDALELRCKRQVKALKERWPLGCEHVGDVAAWAAEVFHCPVWAHKALEERVLYYGQNSSMAAQARKRLKVLITQTGYTAGNTCRNVSATTSENPLEQLNKSIDAVNVDGTVSGHAHPEELNALMARLQQEKNKLVQLATTVRQANDAVNKLAAERAVQC